MKLCDRVNIQFNDAGLEKAVDVWFNALKDRYGHSRDRIEILSLVRGLINDELLRQMSMEIKGTFFNACPQELSEITRQLDSAIIHEVDVNQRSNDTRSSKTRTKKVRRKKAAGRNTTTKGL